MAEAFDLIKIRGNRIEYEKRCIKYNCDDYYCRMFYKAEFNEYLMKYGEAKDYENYEILGILFWPVFMHIYRTSNRYLCLKIGLKYIYH